MAASALTTSQRVALWDGLLTRLRADLRAQGLREVLTPVRIAANAVEPFIEPIEAAGGQLRTSPELAMKRLLAAGAGDIFEVAPVFRASEAGERHREAFHLLEWYRLGEDARLLQRDVERAVAQAHLVSEAVLGCAAAPPTRWERHGLLDLLDRTLGARLRGDEQAESIAPLLEGVRRRCGLRSSSHEPDPRRSPLPPDGVDPEEVDRLAAWTELFSLWSDLALDPWLATRPEVGVHVVDFPAPLAALSRCRGPLADRFESHVRGIELANGYVELREPAVQRARFALVNGLRARHGLGRLPLDEGFLRALEEPGLPPCVGAAMGLERLLMAATGIDDIGGLALL